MERRGIALTLGYDVIPSLIKEALDTNLLHIIKFHTVKKVRGWSDSLRGDVPDDLREGFLVGADMFTLQEKILNMNFRRLARHPRNSCRGVLHNKNLLGSL